MVRDSRKIAAILAADVVDYSRLMGADEAGTLAALKARRAIFEGLVREFDGLEFGSVGDSLMAEFQSAVNAVSCALAIQQSVAQENSRLPVAQRMQLRIGVNLGDVIEERGSFFGDAVNIAARLQALAKPGGVLISGPVYDQVHLKVAARFIDAGTRQVKNILEPVRTFDVVPADPPGLAGRIAGMFARIVSRRALRMAAAVGALLVAVALGLFWREIPVSTDGKRLGSLLDRAPAPNTIAVLPFVNMSGDPGNDYLGDGLAEELSHRLTLIPGLLVAARTSAFAFKDKELGVREIAQNLGVRYVLEGSVKRQADRTRVTAALIEAFTGTSRWSDSYESPSADFLAIESDIGAKVIAALQQVLSSPIEWAPPPPSEGSVAAYDFYLQGLAYLRQAKNAKTLDAAEQLFGRALAEQADFARAQAGLCETRVERYALDKDPAQVAAAEEACARAVTLDSAALEVYMAVGRLRLATGDAGAAAAAYRRALALVPQSPDVLIGLANSLAAGGQVEEAESVYQRAVAAQSRYAATHIAYGSFLFSRGRAADAAVAYERATLLAPDNPTALSNLGGAYMLMGDFEKAAGAFARSLALVPHPGSYANIGIMHYYLGRYREAEDMYRKALELAPGDHRYWGNLADALYFDARVDEARAAYARALELADGELEVNPKHAVNLAQAAYYAIRLGDRQRARRDLTIALSEGTGNIYVHYYVALTQLGLGDAAAAVAHAQRAMRLGYPEQLIRAAPELEHIRRHL